jgi:hypothetical protein
LLIFPYEEKLSITIQFRKTHEETVLKECPILAFKVLPEGDDELLWLHRWAGQALIYLRKSDGFL